MDDNLVSGFAEGLDTAEKPHLILAGLYRALFERDLHKNEWGILGKYLKIYGRWILFEAMIRTATSTTVDMSTTVWPYINSVCAALLQEQLNRRSKQKFRDQELQNTVNLIASLKAVKPEEVNLITEEDL